MARYPIKQMLHKLNYFIIKQEVVKCLLWREIIMQAKQSAKESHNYAPQNILRNKYKHKISTSYKLSFRGPHCKSRTRFFPFQ